MMDRVAIIALLWFAGWIVTTSEFSKLLFNAPGTGIVWGFVIALITVFTWPWVLPRSLEHWMHDPQA